MNDSKDHELINITELEKELQKYLVKYPNDGQINVTIHK